MAKDGREVQKLTPEEKARVDRAAEAIAPRIRDLLNEIPPDYPDETRELITIFAQTGYAKGYLDSLADPLPGQLLFEAGYVEQGLAVLQAILGGLRELPQ